jgi:Zn finger protein HypA/HybF involved in hydrogenase expression
MEGIKMIKFNKNDLFCKKCFIHNTFFKGHGSRIADNCPKCGSSEYIMYENLSFLQKSKARDLFAVMWREKFNLVPDVEI